jgi:hypothetical protein
MRRNLGGVPHDAARIPRFARTRTASTDESVIAYIRTLRRAAQSQWSRFAPKNRNVL